MQNVIIAVNLAKDDFEIAVAKRAGRIQERRRMSRAQFERFWQLREPCTVAMEACDSAHHWSRQLIARCFEVTSPPSRSAGNPHLLPSQRQSRSRVDPERCLAGSHTSHMRAASGEMASAIMRVGRGSTPPRGHAPRSDRQEPAGGRHTSSAALHDSSERRSPSATE
ncbi:MAG: hypothetical protein H0U67_11765 [Gemmatimonadetes bacterium]|nr:hypothetical protein [Gemmatimonadota bacterium]